MIKIVLTGGHAASTALATVEEIKRQKKDWKVYFIGAGSMFEGKRVPTSASLVLPKHEVKYHGITIGRLQRNFSLKSIFYLLKIPVGVLQSFYLLLRIRPKVIISYGGFAALPVVVTGAMLGVPIIIHEQTVVTGLANKISAVFASCIAISREGSRKFFKSDRVILTGNPVIASICEVKPKKEIGKPPTIYITGGSTGAQTINRAVDEILDDLVKKYKVIHQTGKLDYEYFNNKKHKHYETYDFIDPEKIAEIYKKADILVSRSGANTVSEIIITGRPAVLIPIPWTSHNEQGLNAESAKNAGIATILPQDKLDGERLMGEIEKVRLYWSEMVEKQNRELANLDIGASGRLVGLIDGLL